MRNEVRVLAILAPRFREQLEIYPIEKQVVSFFINSRLFFESFKTLLLFIIPLDWKNYFYSDKRLRLFLELVQNDSQSNIVFFPVAFPKNCSISNLTRIFPEQDKDNPSLIHILYSLWCKKIPFLMDLEESEVKKMNCQACTKEFFCFQNIDLRVTNVPPKEKLADFLKEISAENIEVLKIYRKSLSIQDLKFIALLVGFLQNIPKKKLSLCKKLEIHPQIAKKDLKGNGTQEIINAAFSIFRARAFPSSQGPKNKRDHFSIDWHPNSPDKLQGWKLYRVDSVLPGRSGLGRTSGVKRILLAKKGEKTVFLLYTPDHDFLLKQIKKRLEYFRET
ncbi:hypothetical protein ACFL35_05095 [Candidatus Riflebacteria bacterium]